MTREQFEAHVRAEAEKEYPDRVLDNGVYRATELRFHNERHTYIATRMEHEWPLVEALHRIIDLDMAYGDRPSHSDAILALHHIRKTAIATLSPYTTKPIER